MAVNYTLKGIAAALSYNASGLPVIKGDVNVPELILNPGLLALAASPNAKLTSFAGFLAGDTLKIAKVPKGFVAVKAAIQHKAAQATVTVEVGDSANAATFGTGLSVNSATDSILCAQGGGIKIYNSEDYILITFGAATATACSFTVNLFGMLIE